MYDAVSWGWKSTWVTTELGGGAGVAVPEPTGTIGLITGLLFVLRRSPVKR